MYIQARKQMRLAGLASGNSGGGSGQQHLLAIVCIGGAREAKGESGRGKRGREKQLVTVE